MQRWNSVINDWGDYFPGVTVNTSANTVTIATISSNDLYRWWTMSSGGHALPVELTEFKGDCNDGTKTFTWTTASEMNSASFTLEQSTDAVNWTDLKTIAAAGNSNRIMNYSVTDDITKSTDNYYRLKQTDLNGSIHLFNIIHLTCEDQPVAALEIYPNPTTGLFYMRNAPEGAQVEIINPVGQVVYSEKIDSGEPSINLEGLNKGVYIVAIRDGQKTTTNKLMIE